MTTPSVSLSADILRQDELVDTFAFLARAVDSCSADAGGCLSCPLRAECVAMWDEWVEKDGACYLPKLLSRLQAMQGLANRRRRLEGRDGTILFLIGSGAAFSSSAPEASGRSRPGKAARLAPVAETALA